VDLIPGLHRRGRVAEAARQLPLLPAGIRSIMPLHLDHSRGMLERVKASFMNGVLGVRFPKIEKGRDMKVRITAEQPKLDRHSRGVLGIPSDFRTGPSGKGFRAPNA
jgi:hypothetical protein